MSDSLVEHLENWSEQDLPPAASQTEQQVSTCSLLKYVLSSSNIWDFKIIIY